MQSITQKNLKLALSDSDGDNHTNSDDSSRVLSHSFLSEPKPFSKGPNSTVIERALRRTGKTLGSDSTAPSDKKRGKGKTFKLNERLGEEDLYTEYKHFTCPEIIKEQYKILTKLICGFLNTEGGKIYVGIDNAACIKGRQFTKDTKKKFKQTLVKMISSFAPVPPKNAIKIKFYRVFESETQTVLEDRFIVVIKIKKGPADSLFTNEEGRCFYRLDGQTRKYSPEEYQDELILRATKYRSLNEYPNHFNPSSSNQITNLEVEFKQLSFAQTCMTPEPTYSTAETQETYSLDTYNTIEPMCCQQNSTVGTMLGGFIQQQQHQHYQHQYQQSYSSMYNNNGDFAYFAQQHMPQPMPQQLQQPQHFQYMYYNYAAPMNLYPSYGTGGA